MAVSVCGTNAVAGTKLRLSGKPDREYTTVHAAACDYTKAAVRVRVRVRVRVGVRIGGRFGSLPRTAWVRVRFRVTATVRRIWNAFSGIDAHTQGCHDATTMLGLGLGLQLRLGLNTCYGCG